jgi:hypothetical protein
VTEVLLVAEAAGAPAGRGRTLNANVRALRTIALASNNSAAISSTLLSARIARASAPTDASWST